MGESDRAWGSTALRARCSRQARASKRAQSHMCRYARAHAHAQARGRQGTGEAGRGRHKTWRKRDLGQGRLGLGGRKCRRGPGTRTRRVVDVRDARGWARGLRGVGWGRQASAGRPESCDPGATHLGVPRWVEEGPMATACSAPGRS